MSPVSKWLSGLCLCLAAWAHAGPPVFLADLNGRYGSAEYHGRIAEAIAAIIALEPEAVVIAGDMIAGQASPPLSEARIAAMWDNFERAIYQPLKQQGIDVLAVPGNHDASAYPAYSHERQAYERFWRERAPEGVSEDSRFPWYYSVALGAGRFVGLDVTAPGSLSKQQELFLAHHREAANAEGELLLVTSHLPLYPVAIGRESETFSSSLQPEPGEIWVSGHHHAFYAGVDSGGGLLLSLPPLGGNRRAWIGGEKRSPFGFVSLSGDGSPLLYAWPGWEATSPAIGPRQIGQLRRLD